jgi:hypothetical protein
VSRYLRNRIRKLEEIILPAPDPYEGIGIVRIGWELPPLKVELKPGERIVRDIVQRQTRDRNWRGKGIVLERIRVRDRVTSDPNDKGWVCGEDSQLTDIVSKVQANR